MQKQRSIVIVTRPTRLDGLKRRWGTVGQAKFSLTAAHTLAANSSEKDAASPLSRLPKSKRGPTQADFDDYENEDRIYRQAVHRLETELQFDCPVKTIERFYVPNFDFGIASVVVVVGQDGLVANVAKYVGDVPIVAVNPDPTRIDGVLLPFRLAEAHQAVASVLNGRAKKRRVTLAEARVNDGQRLLAFNDFFVGCVSHVSARYLVTVNGRTEFQSSSGVLVSTGAGSTGWISSVYHMAAGVATFLGDDVKPPNCLDWEARELLWAIREPFLSKTTQVGLVAGKLNDSQSLKIESLMPENGVIFSDGIESDFIHFNSGSIVEIFASKHSATLVT